MYLFYGICAIIFGQCIFPNANALVGPNVRQARPGEFPFIVSLIAFNQGPADPVHDHICTAALITTAHVLSAAQCTENRLSNETFVIAGTRNLVNGRIHGIMWWINYNTWSEYKRIPLENTVNDISISKLIRPVDNGILPGVLSYADTSSLNCVAATLAGWGENNHHVISPYMQTTTVRIINNAKCVNKVSRLEKKPVTIDERYICTNGSPFVLLYRGDIGGPLIYQYKIIGINKEILPEMNGHFHPGKINIHTSIRPYKEFIEDVTKTLFHWN